jgi:hypothetical protein
MNGPVVRYARQTQPEIAAPQLTLVAPPLVPEPPPQERALQLAQEIQALLDAAHGDAPATEGYTIRMAQAICSSLIDELDVLVQKAPRSTRPGPR